MLVCATVTTVILITGGTACSPFGAHVLEVLMILLAKPQQTAEADATATEEVIVVLTPSQLRITCLALE